MQEISIQIDGITKEEAVRCMNIIDTCFKQGIFNVRNGKITLNFDSDGVLQEIEFSVKKWRRNKDSIKTVQIYEQAIIGLKN